MGAGGVWGQGTGANHGWSGNSTPHLLLLSRARSGRAGPHLRGSWVPVRRLAGALQRRRPQATSPRPMQTRSPAAAADALVGVVVAAAGQSVGYGAGASVSARGSGQAQHPAVRLDANLPLASELCASAAVAPSTRAAQPACWVLPSPAHLVPHLACGNALFILHSSPSMVALMPWQAREGGANATGTAGCCTGAAGWNSAGAAAGHAQPYPR